jgi:predicted site-specific integrase-resolvase
MVNAANWLVCCLIGPLRRWWSSTGTGLARFGVEHLEAALSAQGRSVVVVDGGEVDDDLVRDMTEVLTLLCARLYGRSGARNRA